MNYCPSNLLSGSSPLSPCVKVQHIQTMSGWEGVLSTVGDHILQKFNILYLTDSEPTKLLDHPKHNLGWKGVSDR